MFLRDIVVSFIELSVPKGFVMYRSLALCLIIGAASGSSFVIAYPKSDQDFAALPKYCHVRMRGTEAESKVVDKRFGHRTFIHLHHYCSGQDYLNKAKVSIDTEKQTLLLSKAVRQFEYIAKHVPSGSVILPENYYNKGIAMKLKKNIPGALSSFQRSIELNKKYTRAYSAISDIYIEAGDKSAAVNILKQGLSLVPNSRTLNRKLKKLE